MKQLIIKFEVFQVDGGVRYESGDSYIEFIGCTQDGNIHSSRGTIGRYERDDFGDLYVCDEDLSKEYIGQTELHYAIDFLTNKSSPLG